MNSPITAALSRERLPLTQYDIDLSPRYKDAAPEEKKTLTALQMDVFVPISLQDRWIGVIALGPKTSGDRFFKQELDTLESIADQTAVALENARLYDHLNQRNQENERLNLDLSIANQELSRLDKAKSDFISIASHELRTPLTQILGYNDILGDMVQGGSVPHSMGMQMVDSVRKAARRLEEIVETMFDVSKVDTNTLELTKSPTSLPLVIATVVDRWSKALEERKINIMVKGLNTLPLMGGK
jgi:signal transduction histidine kinase